MSHSPRPPRALPAVPSLEQQKRQARELLAAARAGDAEALRRVAAVHPRHAGTPALPDGASLALHDAQLVLAREYGFASWPKLRAHLQRVAATGRARVFVRDAAWHEARAHGLVAVLADGAPATLEQVRTWHPDLAGASDAEILAAPFALDDARLVYARTHGFASWTRFRAHLAALDAGGDVDPAREPFLVAFEAARGQDWARVAAVLRAHPALARARGTNGNTLLNLACSLAPSAAPSAAPGEGVASTQATTDAEPRLAGVTLLLAAGADPTQANDRGWTPLHQAAYRNDAAMAARLLAAGAPPAAEAHGAGGTPLAVALFWGHVEVAEVLAEARVVPPNLRIAAGLGRADLVVAAFGADGALTAAARAGRGFYRPHGGFPTWRPTGEPQEVLDEALVWAAKADRVAVLPLLVAAGARVDADPYRGTPLGWAAWNGRVDAARWLLTHGADVNRRATFGGATHGVGVTALHLAAQRGHLPLVELLMAHGADLAARDARYGGTPAAWAAHAGAEATRRYLESTVPTRTAAVGAPPAGGRAAG